MAAKFCSAALLRALQWEGYKVFDHWHQTFTVIYVRPAHVT